MTNCRINIKEIKEIQNYIDLVRSGKYKVCKEQLLLCKLIEKVFKTENLYVDTKQLEEYLDLQKYFPFKLFDWEKFCFALHNCVYTEKGRLRWPILFMLLGRGSGKNGYLAFEDFCLVTPINGIEKYHIDIFAMAEEQARTTFDDIYDILKSNENKMKKHFYWNKEEIINLKTNSKIKFRTSAPKTKDGGRPGKVDFDEYHAYENMKLVNVAVTGLGKKPHPRRTIATTDGDVRDGPLDKLKARAQSILKGDISDNGMLPFICKLDDESEIHKKECWTKANPSLPFFDDLMHEIETEYIDYLEDPIENSAFSTKRMNLPKGNADTEVTSWENILATNQEIPDIEYATCVAGIDYAKTDDFVSAGLLFKYEEKYVWLTHTWICESSKDLHRIKAPIREWSEKGLLTFINGPEIHPDIPAMWLQEMGRKYNITKLYIDNYRYTLLSRSLREHGFDTDKKGRNNIYLVKGSDEAKISPTITREFKNHNIIFGDNPLMRWFTNNSCILEANKMGNIQYGKIEPKSRKTDGFKAFVAAMCGSTHLVDSNVKTYVDFGVYTY